MVHPPEKIFEFVEPALPEASHLTCPVDQRGQGAELSAVTCLAAFVAVAHQPGPLQDSEVLRDGRLRNLGPGRQSPDRLLAFEAQPFEEGPPRRVGERSEEHIVRVRYWQSITLELWIDI